jgi:glycogen operon protein
MRGLDNAVWYRLNPDERRRYLDFTGCGNTLNMAHPRVLALVLDSMRYWVSEMHVDGFRVDLATTLGRTDNHFTVDAPFFKKVREDPLLSRVKLIAEPWDLGPNGYRTGGFPPEWSEWNDKYRDTVRRFWSGGAGIVPELASRLAGSSDLFAWNARSPRASVNYVTSHDGFTLHDLVSYETKHNEANGEDNRDGVSANHSSNSGVEGVSSDPEIVQRRELLKRNMMATLAFSLGVPMISHGDELSRTQAGNNNGYAQDNSITWLNWTEDATRGSLLDFTRHVFAIRRRIGSFQRDAFLNGDSGTAAAKDVTWLDTGGAELLGKEWQRPDRKSFQMLLRTADTSGIGGTSGAFSLLLLNAHDQDERFVLPTALGDAGWRVLVNSADATDARTLFASVVLSALSLVLLQADHGPAPYGALA